MPAFVKNKDKTEEKRQNSKSLTRLIVQLVKIMDRYRDP